MAEQRHRRISRRNLLRIAVYGTAAATGVVQYSTRHWLEVRRETLRLPRWKADGFKVALVSDFHINTSSEIEASLEAVHTAVREKPDVMLFGGDYLNFPKSLKFVEKWCRQLDTSGIPTFAILGNHDFWSSSVPALTELFKKTSVRLMRNAVALQTDVRLVGIDDGIAYKDRHDLLKGLPDTGSSLALFHEPDFVDRVDPSFSLMLAGHSHGGQVCWPFGKPALLPRGARKYWDGFYPDAKVPLFVSRGVGMTGPRVRAFCRPDISILTLRSDG